MIPSSLSYSSSSYSSSSPSTSASSTNVGTIFLPIQVTKSQKNINNNNNNTIKYSSSNTIILNEGQRGYHYIDPPNSFVYHHPKNRIQLVGLKKTTTSSTSLIDTSVSYKISIDYIVGSSGTYIRCSSIYFLLDRYILWMIAREQRR